MNVLAINSSPRVGGDSKTEWVLNHLVEGMKEAGASVEVVALKDKKIRYCSGCFTCWTKTPGKCVHQDDMTKELMPKWLNADMAVYATPLYHYTVNAHLKTFIERTLPIAEPFLINKGGVTTHPIRQNPPKAVVVSVAGFPEDSVFDMLSAYVRFLYHKRLLAEIYRPAAENLMMDNVSHLRPKIADALKKAGRELVESERVAPETMAEITQPLVDNKEEFYLMGNAFWKTCIAEGVTPKEFGKKNIVPRPDAIETYMVLMKMAFNAEVASDVQAVIQFQFSGEIEGTCYIEMNSGTIRTEKGEHETPQMTITAPFEVWMDIMTGKADGQEMFMQQKYTVTGDLNLLMKMGEFFGR